jgi:MFS family permease
MQVNKPPEARRSDTRLLYAARCLRGFGDGFAVVILPAYLTAIGLSPVQIGFVATMSLAGTAALTLLVGLIAPQHDLRNMLLLGAGLMVFTGIALPGFEYLTFVAVVAFIGTINPSTGDIGVLVPLEHAMLARHAADQVRTRTFAHYSLIGALSMAAGALAAGLADIFVALGFPKLAAFKLMFYLYAALGIGAALLYCRLPHAQAEPSRPHATLGPSRGIVYKLAALFSLDAFAGGFIAQSLLALWLFEKFEMSVSAASLFFFWSGVLSAFSYPVAARLAGRIGLINTMVYRKPWID